jgi:hypothetical protein
MRATTAILAPELFAQRGAGCRQGLRRDGEALGASRARRYRRKYAPPTDYAGGKRGIGRRCDIGSACDGFCGGGGGKAPSPCISSSEYTGVSAAVPCASVNWPGQGVYKDRAGRTTHSVYVRSHQQAPCSGPLWRGRPGIRRTR